MHDFSADQPFMAIYGGIMMAKPRPAQGYNLADVKDAFAVYSVAPLCDVTSCSPKHGRAAREWFKGGLGFGDERLQPDPRICLAK